jgi:PmbA protein
MDMDIRKIGEETVKKAVKAGAHEAEVCLETVKSFNVSVRNGEVESLKTSTAKGLGLRVFIDRQYAFSYTSDLSAAAIEDTVKRTVDMARKTEAKPWHGLPDFGPQTMPDLDIFDPGMEGVPDEKKIAIAREVEKIALASDERITNSYGGSFSNGMREGGIFNSKGVSCLIKETSCAFSVSVIAGEGAGMQGGGWSSAKRYFKDLASVEEVARTAAERTTAMLGARPTATARVPVVFDRYAASSFWAGILSALNGDAAFRKTTFMADSLEKPIASPLITIVDDPTIPRHIASMPFDGEGGAVRKNTVIDKGVLKMFFYDSQTARKAGVQTPTIARRGGYKSGPFAGYLNIIVRNGASRPEDLFKDMKQGLWVHGMRGTGTDVTTGSFSVGVSGFRIEDGKPVHPVDGVTLGGTTRDILNAIDRVADDLDMRGGLSSPSFRVAEITVGGRKG